MDVVLVTGGARAGKSDWAEREASRLGGERVTVIATAEPRDDEMRTRIAAHRAARPAGWTTVEAPLDVASRVRDATTPVVVLDCLTLLCANALERDGADGVEDEVDALLEAARDREGTLIVVSNEVGWGIVPASPLARTFRDALGRANARVAAGAAGVVLLVAGLPLWVRSP